jgi:hypothetical protein
MASLKKDGDAINWATTDEKLAKQEEEAAKLGDFA